MCCKSPQASLKRQRNTEIDGIICSNIKAVAQQGWCVGWIVHLHVLWKMEAFWNWWAGLWTWQHALELGLAPCFYHSAAISGSFVCHQELCKHNCAEGAN